MSSPLVSVILSTYERPDALRLVLEGYARVDYEPIEVIVADDGSGPETAETVRRFASSVAFRVRHSWQEDEGFRLAAVRNRAVRAAEGAILVFTDGDCVPFSGALRVHAERCRPGWAVAGERCWLGDNETSELLAAGAVSPEVLERSHRRERRRLNVLKWKNRWYRWTRSKPRPKLGTCNAAVHRDDFERVNGFDERYVGWGYEDEDFARRLRRSGVRIVDATQDSLVLHLFHKVHESHRPNARSSPNYERFKRDQDLLRPLRGFRYRELETLSFELLGQVPGELRETTASVATPDVSLVFGQLRRGDARPRGEVVLRIPEDSAVASREHVYRILSESFG